MLFVPVLTLTLVQASRLAVPADTVNVELVPAIAIDGLLSVAVRATVSAFTRVMEFAARVAAPLVNETVEG